MGFKNMTVSVDEDIIEELKYLALEKKTSQKEIINRYLKEGLKREKGQTKLDE